MSNIFVFKDTDKKIVQLSELHMPWTNSYKLKYYAQFIECIFKKRSWLTPKAVYTLVGKDFILNDELFKAWELTFKCNHILNYQFAYYSYFQSLIFFTILNDLGANFTKLLHVGVGFFYSPKFDLKKNKNYEIIIKPTSLYRLSEHKVIFESKTYVIDENKKICIINKNDFLLTNVKLDLPVETHRQKYNRLSKRSPATHKDQSILTIQPAKVDIRNYSKVSGDYNPVHSNKTIAKFFGFKNIFMHGLMLSNYIVKSLTEHFSEKLWTLEVTFTNPVFENQVVSLRINDDVVEIVDKNEQLKLFGKFKMMDTHERYTL